MEVSCTYAPSRNDPTEGDDLSGAAVANLYIALRCAGVFFKSCFCAKSDVLCFLKTASQIRGKEMRFSVSSLRKKPSLFTLSQ